MKEIIERLDQLETVLKTSFEALSLKIDPLSNYEISSSTDGSPGMITKIMHGGKQYVREDFMKTAVARERDKANKILTDRNGQIELHLEALRKKEAELESIKTKLIGTTARVNALTQRSTDLQQICDGRGLTTSAEYVRGLERNVQSFTEKLESLQKKTKALLASTEAGSNAGHLEVLGIRDSVKRELGMI